MPQQRSDLEGLLEYLKRTRGFDFTGYKRASLERRIVKRMQAAGCASFADYLDFLEVHPEEFPALFNTILINVTTFFRDAESWAVLSETVVPDLLKRRDKESTTRIWSAGCASGEEAYTLAIVFAEALGLEAFKASVKIYATDVDEEALAKARLGAYSETELGDMPDHLVKKYFERQNGQFVFRKDLRRQIIFGRHDLIQDAPISRVDMLVCRNTLMYFNAETQARILARFQFALNDYGILFLGRAETLMTHATAFVPIDLKRRISSKVPIPGSTARERVLTANRNGGGNGGPPSGGLGVLPGAALDAIPTAQLIIDPDGQLAAINERARVMFGIPATDIGRPLKDLKISYRPVELRAAIDTAYAEHRTVILRDIEWLLGNGDTRWLELHIVPLVETDGTAKLLGASVAFHDVSVAKRLQRDLERSNYDLSAAQEELQSTNEELETTNEELQSTVEELETTNEELQSTNEELETMNEELQSTNEELETMNDELRQRSDDLNHVNGFLESILTSMRGAVMVLDAELRVLVWNQSAHELWGLREEEVRHKHIFGLDIGLPIDRLRPQIRACLNGTRPHTSVTLPAVNRRGKAITCHATISPLMNPAGAIQGVILATEEIAPAKAAKPAAPAKVAKPAQPTKKRTVKKGSGVKRPGKRR